MTEPHTDPEDVQRITPLPSVPSACPGGAAPVRTGGESSNTPPLNSNDQVFTGGEDWLEWSLYVDWSDSWEAVRSKLEQGKEIAADKEIAKATGGDVVQFGLYDCLVGPGGACLGKKGKGVYMAYRFTVNGMVIQIANQAKSDRTPNARCRADGNMCLCHGGKGCLDLGRAVISTMGGIIVKEKLSRVDMCLDLPWVPVNAFSEAFNNRHYVCRARGRGYHESSGVTLYLGKHPLTLRIYDKLAEVKEKADPVKALLMKIKRWGNTDVKSATRVEFELGRETLKHHGIDSPDDYFRKRRELVDYLCGQWIRFTAGTVDRTNTTRTAIMPLWETVTSGFQNWTGKSTGESLEALESEGINTSQLRRQGLGVYLTIAVHEGKGITSPESFMDYAMQTIKQTIRSVNFEKEILKRQIISP